MHCQGLTKQTCNRLMTDQRSKLSIETCVLSSALQGVSCFSRVSCARDCQSFCLVFASSDKIKYGFGAKPWSRQRSKDQNVLVLFNFCTD